MMSIASTALLFSINILCVLGSETPAVEVQSGQSATLLCSNFTSSPSSITWYRAVRRSSTLRWVSMISSPDRASSVDETFRGTSNLSHIFLTINPVNTSHTGLYLCGYRSSLGLVIKESTYLDVQEDDTKAVDKSVLVPVLGGLVAFQIVVIIGLAVKNKMLKIAQTKQLARQTETENSDNLEYADSVPNPGPLL